MSASSTTGSSKTASSEKSSNDRQPVHWKRCDKPQANTTTTTDTTITVVHNTETVEASLEQCGSIQQWVDRATGQVAGQAIVCEKLVLESRWLKKFNRRFLENRSYSVPSDITDELACEMLRNDPYIPGVLSIHCLPDFVSLNWPCNNEIISTMGVVHQSATGLACNYLSIMRSDGLTCHFDLKTVECSTDLENLLQDATLTFIGYDFVFITQIIEEATKIRKILVKQVDLLDILTMVIKMGSLVLGFPICSTDLEALAKTITTGKLSETESSSSSITDKQLPALSFDTYAVLEQSYDELKTLITQYHASQNKHVVKLPQPMIWSQNRLFHTNISQKRPKVMDRQLNTEIEHHQPTIPKLYLAKQSLPLPTSSIMHAVEKEEPTCSNTVKYAHNKNFTHTKFPLRSYRDFNNATVQQNNQLGDLRARDIEKRFSSLINKMLDDFSEQYKNYRQAQWNLEYERFFEHYTNELHRCYAFSNPNDMCQMDRRLRKALTKKIVEKSNGGYRY